MAIAKFKIVNRFGVMMMTVVLAGFVAACASTAPEPVDTPEVVVVDDPVDAAAEAEIVAKYDGDGMEIPLDGSSLEAFEASVAMVKRHTDEDNYETLQRAINYLLVYDLGAKRDKAKLAERLDGNTGYEVIALVGWRKPRPGKSAAEKGAADVSIIDT